MAVKRLQLLVLCLLAAVVVASAFPLHWPKHDHDPHRKPEEKHVDDKKIPDCDKPDLVHEAPNDDHCGNDSTDPHCVKDHPQEDKAKHEEKPKEQHIQEEEKPKCDHCGKDDETKRKGRCGPLAHWHSCAHYVQESYFFKGPHEKFAPKPHYHSLCCNQVRAESVECMCKAASAKYGHYTVDMERTAMLPMWCKKVVPHGSKCNGKDVVGYVHEEQDNGYGHGYGNSKPGHHDVATAEAYARRPDFKPLDKMEKIISEPLQ